MQHGDFIITPSWTFHDHGSEGSEGSEPVIWLDGLDIPLVQFLSAGFQEKLATDVQAVTRPEGDSLARYGHNLVPVDFVQTPSEPTRVFAYPYAQTREALDGIAHTAPDPHHGHKLRYVNPATGASPMPTIGAFASRLPAGLETRAVRCTDSTIYCCLEGAGITRVGDVELRFEPNDVFVVPSWMPLQLQAQRETTLFSYSDRPVQQVLGLWREQKSVFFWPRMTRINADQIEAGSFFIRAIRGRVFSRSNPCRMSFLQRPSAA